MDCQWSDHRYGLGNHSISSAWRIVSCCSSWLRHQPSAEPIQPKSSTQSVLQKSYLQQQNHPASNLKHLAVGITSWHGHGFYGRQTANSERLRKGALTAAHRTLSFGTIVGVINLKRADLWMHESTTEDHLNITAWLISPMAQPAN